MNFYKITGIRKGDTSVSETFLLSDDSVIESVLERRREEYVSGFKIDRATKEQFGAFIAEDSEQKATEKDCDLSESFFQLYKKIVLPSLILFLEAFFPLLIQKLKSINKP